jgi:hypothetical protein
MVVLALVWLIGCAGLRVIAWPAVSKTFVFGTGLVEPQVGEDAHPSLTPRPRAAAHHQGVP